MDIKQFKYHKQLILLVAFLAAGWCHSAYAFQYSKLNYSVVSESAKTVMVASQNKSTSLSGSVVIPSKVTYNGNDYTVVEIDGDAFIECRNIAKIVVPSSVTKIGGGSFAYCSSLETLDLGAGVETIGADLYTGLSNLKTVISRNPTPPSIRNWGTVKTSATLYVPEGSINAYKQASIWGYFTSVLAINYSGDDNPDISDDNPDVKKGFSNIQILTVGNLIEEITPGLFKEFTELTKVTLGSGLKVIGDEAFSGCMALTEVILPPSVKTIGASAFAGNNKLASIIMGHNVTTIGEKAFDLCPAQTVSITAQTPPQAPDNTFSNYTGSLYVQGQEAADAYYDADYCWYQFEGHVMIEPTEFKVEGDKILNGKPGDTFQLTATLYPEDVTLPHVFWRSTNPDIATVDANGLVTLHADMSDIMAMAEGDDETTRTCKIIAESLYADGPVAEFRVNDSESGIDDVTIGGSDDSGDIDFNATVEVYNLQGVMVGDNIKNLTAGIYIVRQGKIVKKLAVR